MDAEGMWSRDREARVRVKGSKMDMTKGDK